MFCFFCDKASVVSVGSACDAWQVCSNCFVNGMRRLKQTKLFNDNLLVQTFNWKKLKVTRYVPQ